jgi:mono/diheme cytochrome c family protein
MTKRQVLVFVAVASFFSATACKNEQTQTSSPVNTGSPAKPTSTPDPFAAARATFERNCKECHGPNGEGGPVKLADGTRLKVPPLREGHAVRHKDADLLKQITKGGDGMPAFADKLKPEEINELIKFIRREFQAGATPK